MNSINIKNINFDKLGGLIPVCVQDYNTLQVLMVGFMNKSAVLQTLETQLVTFYSRSKNRLWTKGESSGNYLKVVHLSVDCDQDSILAYVQPTGPTCHTGDESCFHNSNSLPPLYWIGYLNEVIKTRRYQGEESYTSRLMSSGVKRLAQKVGEEGVEVALAALSDNPQELVEESVDLIYHLFVLLQAKEVSLSTLSNVIRSRRKNEARISVGQ